MVLDLTEFVARCMARVVKSTSFCAFVRQLNGYGFSKIDPKRAVFNHSGNLFVRGHPELLHLIRRKKSPKRHASDSRAGQERSKGARVSGNASEDEDVSSDGEPAVVSSSSTIAQVHYAYSTSSTTAPRSGDTPPLGNPSLHSFASQFGLTYGGAPAATKHASGAGGSGDGDDTFVFPVPPSLPSVVFAAPTSRMLTAVPRVPPANAALASATAANMQELQAQLATSQAQCTALRESLMALVMTAGEISATASNSELWEDGTAGKLVQLSLANYLRGQTSTFRSLRDTSATPDNVSKGLSNLLLELASSSRLIPPSNNSSSTGGLGAEDGRDTEKGPSSSRQRGPDSVMSGLSSSAGWHDGPGSSGASTSYNSSPRSKLSSKLDAEPYLGLLPVPVHDAITSMADARHRLDAAMPSYYTQLAKEAAHRTYDDDEDFKPLSNEGRRTKASTVTPQSHEDVATAPVGSGGFPGLGPAFLSQSVDDDPFFTAGGDAGGIDETEAERRLMADT